MIALKISSMKNFMSQLLVSDTFDSFLLEEAVIKTANTFSIDGRVNRDFYSDSNAEIDATEPAPPPAASPLSAASAPGEAPHGSSQSASAALTPAAGTGYEFRPWREIKGLCFDLIKGRRSPLSLQFVLHLMPEQTKKLLEKEGLGELAAQVRAFVLTIRYDGACTQLITGTSYGAFTLSKEADTVWDQALEKFLRLKGIDCERL